MNNGLKTVGLMFVFLVCIFTVSSIYTVSEGHEALLLRLGKLTRTSDGKIRDIKPGLHFKVPFINQVRVFDVRLQTLDIKSSRIVTKQKKDVIVDYYVKWRIQDLARYFKTTGGNSFKASTLLEQKLNTALRAEFGKRTIADVVSGERDDVMDILNKKANEGAENLGIQVKDVRIKGIDLPASTSNTIYRSMRANMEKIANRHRAEGRRDSEAIQAEADARVTVLMAKASNDGKQVRAKGQAKAARIYADAYNKDKDFFDFYRSLKAYEISFNTKQDVLVLDQKTHFFDYFKDGVKK